MSVQDQLTLTKNIGFWLHRKTSDLSIPTNKRDLVSAALLQHVLDLADGIALLIDRDLRGPAFALLRPLHEALVRAVWLGFYAQDEWVVKFAGGKYPGFKDMLKALTANPDEGWAFIKEMSEKNMDDFHGLTHGGIEHAERRLTPGSIEPNYPDAEVLEALKMKNRYSLLAAWALLTLAKEQEKLSEIESEISNWSGAL